MTDSEEFCDLENKEVEENLAVSQEEGELEQHVEEEEECGTKENEESACDDRGIVTEEPQGERDEEDIPIQQYDDEMPEKLHAEEFAPSYPEPENVSDGGLIRTQDPVEQSEGEKIIGQCDKSEFKNHIEHGHLFKPRKTPYRQPARWVPVEHDLREDSDDEFETMTAFRPLYDEEQNSSTAHSFKNGEPDYQGEFLSCFDEPNLLYRICNHEEKTWAFYNDTYNYEMQVRFTFGRHSKLQALENTTIHTTSDGEYVAEVVVYPGETEMFVTGTVNGFTSKLRAVPVSDEYHQRRQKIAEIGIQEEIEQIKQLVGDVTDAETVLAVCVNNNIPFVDLEFPPCQASLDKGAKKRFNQLPWARPSSYLPDDMIDQVRLFRSPIRPGNFDHGELGDIWVMCSVAALSENPKSIVNMFRHPTDIENGKRERAVGGYRVTFNKHGLWRSVIVDNYLPICGVKPKYAKSNYDLAEIWPSILEKAFAKMHGSYANISSGDPLQAFQDMSGYPSFRFYDAFSEAIHSGKDDLFQEWLRYAKANYQMILTTPGRDPNTNLKDSKLSNRYKSVGLTIGHAYTVLDVKYLPEYELRMVKIRNAWGRSAQWNGDWCDDDEKWEQYPEVAEVCNFQHVDDGTFWMTWEACLHYFNGGGVSFTHSSVNDYRVSSMFVGAVPSCILEISVEQPTWICFTISQEDIRVYRSDAEYHPVMLSVAQPMESGLYRVVQNSSADASHPLSDKWTFFRSRDISLMYKFLPEKSPYLLIPRVMELNGRAEEIPYTLGFSCNKLVGHDGVTVQFKALEKDNKVFLNFPKFESETIPVTVEYQAKMTDGSFPATKTGFAVY